MNGVENLKMAVCESGHADAGGLGPLQFKMWQQEGNIFYSLILFHIPE